ncbi:MAG: hypothetical protein JWQ27_10 [Ferruginibacter sp.]|nr:hypothetical protein [Ferruginibacter sp.]
MVTIFMPTPVDHSTWGNGTCFVKNCGKSSAAVIGRLHLRMLIQQGFRRKEAWENFNSPTAEGMCINPVFVNQFLHGRLHTSSAYYSFL